MLSTSVVCSIPLVSTLLVEPSLTVVPVFVASTSSSLTGVTVTLNVPLLLVPAPSSTLKSKLSRGRLAAVVIVGHVAGVDVGLCERVAHAQRGSRQPQRAVAGGRRDRVDQLAAVLSTSVVCSIAAGQHVAGRAFVDRRARVRRQYLFVVDRRDRDVERATASSCPAPSSTLKSNVSVVVSLPSWS